jgi:hypothetical protein
MKEFPSGMYGEEYEKILILIENEVEAAAARVAEAEDRETAIICILRCIATDMGINESTEI